VLQGWGKPLHGKFADDAQDITKYNNGLGRVQGLSRFKSNYRSLTLMS
jgi:hypothetical protein